MTDDFFLVEEDSSIESVLWRSAPEVVREMLEELSGEQRQAYEEMARPNATPLLENSLAQRNERGLREVLRRFGASSTGVRAARVLAEIAIESGRWRDAERYVQEGLRFAPRDPALWARLIDAMASSEDRHGLENLEPPADLSFESPGKPASLVERKQAALASLPDTLGLTGWPIWGGVPARNAHLPDEPPMPTRRRWVEDTDLVERRQDRTRYNWRGRGRSDDFEEMLENFRPLHPVVHGRTVFVADGRSVRAFDVYSGRRVWIFDGATNPELKLAVPRSGAPGRTSLERAFSPIVVDDLLIATVEVRRAYEPEFLQAVEISSYLPRRIVVALDRVTGKLRWAMGRSGIDFLTLGSMSIVSSPAVAEGLVLAIGSAHRNVHNVSFLAFDLRTGALRWRRPLGFGQQELNLFGAPIKELAASPVAVADGVAYASTGLGFIAAVDIRSGVPRWLASYEIIPIQKVQFWYAAPWRKPLMAQSPPVVHEDLLVVAPTDGKHLYAFDRRTGRLRWRQPYVIRNLTYGTKGQFLGVVNDGRRDVALLSDHELRARDLETGKVVWRGRFEPQRSAVIGRGAVAGGDVLVPTRAGLQRFSLKSDGAYRGTVPWPENSRPGNVLPLSRVLLVTSRSQLQWFYDWAAIERDVQRRRKERPDDPTILLEAGEMFLRGGGETERARKAFEEARRVARKSRPEYESRALNGLYATYLLEGDQTAPFPKRAVQAYEKSLEYAQTPEERVEARLRIHRALAHDGPARIDNLTKLVEEADQARAHFDLEDAEVPARAAALFLLAREHVLNQQPAKAVDALQRILREERNAMFPSGPAYERATQEIAEILDEAGALAYRRHEKKARALLARAQEQDDPKLLDRLLNEYPNAAAVPAALLERGRRLLAEGKAADAAVFLRRLLAESPDDKHGAAALAGLVRAYRESGAIGAARFALARLAAAHKRDRFEWDGKTWDGAAFAKAEAALLEADLATEAPKATLQTPLREVAFEAVGEDDFARPITVTTDSTVPGGPHPAPIALMMRGRELVGIDMCRAKVAWTAKTGHCQKAAYTGGVVAVAVRRALVGLDASTGETLWSRDMKVIVRELQVARGQVFALVQDLSGLAGEHRLIALDAYRGEQLWNIRLGREDYRNLRPWNDQLLLQYVKIRRTRAASALLILDGFSGARRHTIPIPLEVEGTPAIAGSLYCVAGHGTSRRQRELAAFDLQRGRLKWREPLKGREAICGIATHDEHLVVLRRDGSLSSHALAHGGAVHQTRVFVGDVGSACPFPGTPMIAENGRLTLFPWVRRPTLSVVSYDIRSGKLVWEQPWSEEVSPSKAVVLDRGKLLCVMVSYPKNRLQSILVRLIDKTTGRLVQEIEPEGLARANWIPSMIEGHGTLVVFGKSGASIFRGSDGKKDPK